MIPKIEKKVVQPDVAIIANAFTPYRTALHLRIAREIPQVRLHSIFTHDISNAPWSGKAPSEINAVCFGAGQAARQQNDPRHAITEWKKGGRILDYIKQHNVRAVVLLGYNDLGRMRVIQGCRSANIPLFLFGDSNIRGDHARGIKRLIKKNVVGWAVRRSTGVMPCGTLGRDYFQKYGAQSDRVFYFPYEPDYALIESLSHDVIASVMKRFDLKSGRRRFIFSARLVHVKRPDLVIDAFSEIATQRPEWDLVMVGDGPLRASVELRIPEVLRPRVTFTGFIDNQSVVSALYRSSDVLILPSDYEPWALVVNEAAAAGLAMICTDVVGAAAELVRDGENGAVVPTGSAAALAKAMLKVSDPSRIDDFKSQSKRVLQEWRERGDPVVGLRHALQFAGLLELVR